jgi:hypothetical protein
MGHLAEAIGFIKSTRREALSGSNSGSPLSCGTPGWNSSCWNNH